MAFNLDLLDEIESGPRAQPKTKGFNMDLLAELEGVDQQAADPASFFQPAQINTPRQDGGMNLDALDAILSDEHPDVIANKLTVSKIGSGFTGFPTKHPMVQNEDGSRSNVILGGFGIGGREYVIPTMVDGKMLSAAEAVSLARKHGLDKYPSFGTVEEANKWAEENHANIDENGVLGKGVMDTLPPKGIPFESQQPINQVTDPSDLFDPATSLSPHEPPAPTGEMSQPEKLARFWRIMGKGFKAANQQFEDMSVTELDKEMFKILQVMSDIGTSPAFLIPGGQTMGERVERGLKLAEELKGFGPALAPAAGESVKNVVEIAAYQKLFGVTHKAFSALGKTAKAKKLGDAINKIGGIKKFKAAHPRLYAAERDAIRAFTEGAIVGTGVGTLEVIDQGVKGGEAVKQVGKKAVAVGVTAAVFSGAASRDRKIAVDKFRKAYTDTIQKQTDTEINKLPGRRGHKDAPAIIAKENLRLQQIDSAVSEYESDILGTTQGKLFKEGAEKPAAAARRIASRPFDPKATPKGVKSLKTGLGSKDLVPVKSRRNPLYRDFTPKQMRAAGEANRRNLIRQARKAVKRQRVKPTRTKQGETPEQFKEAIAKEKRLIVELARDPKGYVDRWVKRNTFTTATSVEAPTEKAPMTKKTEEAFTEAVKHPVKRDVRTEVAKPQAPAKVKPGTPSPKVVPVKSDLSTLTDEQLTELETKIPDFTAEQSKSLKEQRAAAIAKRKAEDKGPEPETYAVDTIDGIEYKLFEGSKGPAIRVYDTDAGETVSVKIFPNRAMADEEFEKGVEEARRLEESEAEIPSGEKSAAQKEDEADQNELGLHLNDSGTPNLHSENFKILKERSGVSPDWRSNKEDHEKWLVEADKIGMGRVARSTLRSSRHNYTKKKLEWLDPLVAGTEISTTPVVDTEKPVGEPEPRDFFRPGSKYEVEMEDGTFETVEILPSATNKNRAGSQYFGTAQEIRFKFTRTGVKGQALAHKLSELQVRKKTPPPGDIVIKSARTGEEVDRIPSGEKEEPVFDYMPDDIVEIERDGETIEATVRSHHVEGDDEKVSVRVQHGRIAEVVEVPASEVKVVQRGSTFEKAQKETEPTEQAPDAKLADFVFNHIKAGKTLDAKTFFGLADQAYGGTRAEGKYGVSDAYDALEVGINHHLRWKGYNPSTKSISAAVANVKSIESLLSKIPTQTNRSGEKDKFQQFSTPPHYSYALSWVANIDENDVVLEPSAGTGAIAVHAFATGATVIANELSERRATLLRELPFDEVFTEDAEQIHNILHDKVKPTVILMNPPFSRAATRMGTKMVQGTDLKHIDAALALLQDNGRLVAIMGAPMFADKGENKSFLRWLDKVKKTHNVMANVQVDRKVYKKYGTQFPTKVLVIDKTGPTTGDTEVQKVDTVEDLLYTLEGVRNERTKAKQRSIQPTVEKEAGSVETAAGSKSTTQPTTPDLGAGESEVSGAVGTKPAGPIEPGKADAELETQEGTEDTGKPDTRTGDTKGKPDADSVVSSGEPSGVLTDIHIEGSEAAIDKLVAQPKKRKKPKKVKELTDNLFESYTPPATTIQNAQPHPASLVESAAMSAVDSPLLNYELDIPQDLIDKGEFSDVQLAFAAYAGMAHSQMLPANEGETAYRRGIFNGDGTGVGKGREISAVILDNLMKGRKKALWISENDKLFKDAQRDWSDVGQDKNQLFQLKNTKASDKKVKVGNGIMYATYGSLRSKSQGNDPVYRIQQIIDWFGKDYDGVIAFDESHNMANAVQSQGARGSTAPAAMALAGLKLQRELPNARVVYVSATGATEVRNLAYAQRLGLWGTDTPFVNQSDFINQITDGGVAAMETVAKDLKALGLYFARSISFNDGTVEGTVTYEPLVHKLTKDQRIIYNKMAEGWQVTLNNFEDAVELTGGGGKGARAAFWGANLRFFDQVITSLQTPSVINSIEKDMEEGRSAVIQLTSTFGEAIKRKLADREAGDDLDEIDLTPRETLMGLVEHSFPTAQYETYIDESGNEASRPVLDSDGNIVENQQAVAMREQLLDELGSIRIPDAPIDMIINHFGPEAVSEITGRKIRVVNKTQADGTIKKVIDKRGAASNAADIDRFMDGKKRILIFSQAGGTGASYHASNKVNNKQQRVHYLLQAGWRADKALQGLGRTHRSNQKQAPIYKLVTTDLNGQKRFISSIARKLAQLGALGSGDRRTGSSGLFTAADNLESHEASQALRQFFKDLDRGVVDGIDMQTYQEQTGLRLYKPDGNLKKTLPEIKQFLNRLLPLEIDFQNQVFNAFEERLQAKVEQAIADGTLDQGMETFRADHIKKVSEQDVYTHPGSGAKTQYVKMETKTKNKAITWETINNRAQEFYVQSVKSGKLYGVKSSFARTDGNTGRIVDQYKLTDQRGTSFIDKDHIDRSGGRWQKVDEARAKTLWNEAVEALPEFHSKDIHLISGLLLPIWDRLIGKPKITRMLTDDGEQLVGRIIGVRSLKSTLKALGADIESPKMAPDNVVKGVLDGNFSAELANGWTMQLSRVQGENRIEIKGPAFQHFDQLRGLGAFTERIAGNTRTFLPVGDTESAEKVLAKWPVAEIIYRSGQDPTVDIPSASGGFAGGRPRTAANVQVSAIVQENMSTGSKDADAFLKRTKGFTGTGQPGILRRTAHNIYKFGEDFRYLSDLPGTPEFANIREHFRHTEEIAGNAQTWAIGRMKWAIKPIEGTGREVNQRLKALELKLIADDLSEDIEKEVALPPGLTPDDVQAMQDRADELFNKYPSVREAHGRLREVTIDITDKLISEGMLKPEQAKEFYFPHRVIKYLRQEDGFFTGIPNKGPVDYKKGYLKQRKGGVDYSTDILHRLVEHWSQVQRDVEYGKFLQKVLKQEQHDYFRQEHPDWKEYSTNAEGKRTRNAVPDGYKEVTVLPGRFYYKANGITEDLAMAIINQQFDDIEDIITENSELRGQKSVRKVLALGKKRSYIVREPIAIQIYNMPTLPISQNAAYLAVKGINTFIKGQILFNPLYVVPFHVQNFIGDASKVLVALPSALRADYLAGYWQEIINAHNGETSERFELAQKYGVIGSGWIGTDLPNLKEIMPEIARAEISGGAALLNNKIKHAWNIVKNVGAGREDWLRYTLYDRLMDLQAGGKDISRYAIKDSHLIKFIEDPAARAAKVARDIAGDYAAIGKSGRILSDIVSPFYRWMHLNTPWWPRMIKEYLKKGQGFRLIYALLAAAAPYVISQLWNEADPKRRAYQRTLPPWRRWNFHVVNTEGTGVLYVNLPLDDIMNILGIPEDIVDFQRYQRGMIDMPELMKRIAINSINEPGMAVVNSIGGAAGVVQSTVGLQTFPEIKPYLVTDPKRKALNVAGDIFGAPGSLGKEIFDREGIKMDPKTGEIVINQKTKDLLNRSWMGIKPYHSDVKRTQEILGKSVYKRKTTIKDSEGRKIRKLRGEAHKGKQRKVDSLKIQLEKE